MAAPYATVNLMGAYSFKFADTKMTAQVNVTNLLDAAYYTQAGVLDSFAPRPGFAANATRLYGAPLTILGSLKAEFDHDPRLPDPPPSIVTASHGEAGSNPGATGLRLDCFAAKLLARRSGAPVISRKF